MFLKERDTGHLVEVIDVEELFNPNSNRLIGKLQIGEADQDEEVFNKQSLVFMSGEELPKCWLN
ncbi:MAG: hypothetical protein OQJ89_07700 [Kangiellaceae bacterium]|nr:hypothetical protein [Kangiellaceae bacterium]MCW9016830.1 hypothetical protein [Kangiellaceae bacterium]